MTTPMPLSANVAKSSGPACPLTGIPIEWCRFARKTVRHETARRPSIAGSLGVDVGATEDVGRGDVRLAGGATDCDIRGGAAVLRFAASLARQERWLRAVRPAASRAPSVSIDLDHRHLLTQFVVQLG